MSDLDADVIVIGTGNAGFSAAHAARARGRRVIMLDKAPESEAGGNSYFTAGATRIAHNGLADLRSIIDDDPRLNRSEVPAYSSQQYLDDLARVTNGRSNPELGSILASEGLDSLRWLHSLGMKYRLMYERQAYESEDGTYRFWGGLHVGNTGGGVGLVEDHTRIAKENGVEIRYNQPVVGLLTENGKVSGALVQSGSSTPVELRAESVVIASGGFEADADRRAEYLGEPWRNAVVRGTLHNTGELLDVAIGLGAARGGDWTTAHSVQWDAWAEGNSGNRQYTNRFTRQSYPLGIIVDNTGQRFADEGEEFRNYTYAKLGRQILTRPNGIAFQIFDATTRHMLRIEEYDMPGISHYSADTLECLARDTGIDPAGLVQTIEAFNVSITTEMKFDPSVLDGRKANTVPAKSNWALAIETPPFHAYPVACGVTFTFGGLATTTHGEVIDSDGEVIPGLFAVGEALGGLFSGNYPGGSGLAAGVVFGRRAGSRA